MSKSINIKGKIQFVTGKKTLMKYADPSLEAGFEENLYDTMMANFLHLNFSLEEKKQLSRSHRQMLNYYRHINLFSLNSDAKNLISAINQSKEKRFVIEANNYGAYVCLAALYSGKLPENKKIEFILENAPLALFPKAFIKAEPKMQHKVVFRLSEDCWLSSFSSLYNNQGIKHSLDKKFIKKAA